MKVILKKAFIKLVLSSETFFKPLRALLFDDQVYDRVLADERLSTRIFGDDRARQKILADNSLLDDLLLNERVRQKVIVNDQLVDAMLADERTQQKILANDPLLDDLLTDERTRQKVIANSQLFDSILADGRTRQLILSNDPLVGFILNDGRTQQKILTNGQLLKSILQDRRIPDQIFGHKLLLQKILSDGRMLPKVLAHTELFNKIVTHGQTLQNILSNVQILEKILLDIRAIDKIFADVRLLDRILLDPRTFDKIFSDARLLERLLLDGRTFEKIVTDTRLLDKVLLDARVLEKILADARILDRVLLDARTTEKSLTDVRILDRILLDARTVETVLTNIRVMNGNRFYNRLAAAIEFQQDWQKISPFISTTKAEIKQRYQTALAKACAGNQDVQNLILDVICQRDEVFLKNGTMKFHNRQGGAIKPDRRALWTLLHEILINEDYYFETNVTAPRILDCGTNFGLTIYYFKTLYPQAKITGFEPFPNMYQLAIENVHNNNFKDVEILPYALADTEQQATFLTTSIDPMAGSLTERRRVMGHEVSEITVECRRLSDFLQEPIHYLKLDIEGVEDLVLAETEQFLGNVQYIFCEYHHGSGLKPDRLTKILQLLDQANFDVQVSKAFNFYNQTYQQPMNFVSRFYSVLIWAKNRNWKY